MSLTPPSINFGSVVVGSTLSQAVIVSNTGTATLHVTQATLSGQEFSVGGASVPFSLGPGQQVTVTAAFSPTTVGSASESIAISSDATSNPVTVSLSGTGIAATRVLAANPTSLSFGKVSDGGSSSQTVTLTNNGNSDVTISAVTVTGAGFSASGVSSGLTLAPNQSATLSVTFAPTTAGIASGSVSVASNATNSPTTVSVSGSGVQQSSSHSVSLSWTASTSSGVTGYYVYRRTVSGVYSKITTSPVPGTTYSDASVQSGQNITHYYVVTAVNSSGVESADSNQASATVP